MNNLMWSSVAQSLVIGDDARLEDFVQTGANRTKRLAHTYLPKLPITLPLRKASYPAEVLT